MAWNDACKSNGGSVRSETGMAAADDDVSRAARAGEAGSGRRRGEVCTLASVICRIGTEDAPPRSVRAASSACGFRVLGGIPPLSVSLRELATVCTPASRWAPCSETKFGSVRADPRRDIAGEETAVEGRCVGWVGDIRALEAFLPFLFLPFRTEASALGGVMVPARLEDRRRICKDDEIPTGSASSGCSVSRPLPLEDAGALVEPDLVRGCVAPIASLSRSRPLQMMEEPEATQEGEGSSSTAAARDSPTAVLMRASVGRETATSASAVESAAPFLELEPEAPRAVAPDPDGLLAPSSPLLAASCAWTIFRSALSFFFWFARDPVIFGVCLQSRAMKSPLPTRATTSPRAMSWLWGAAATRELRRPPEATARRGAPSPARAAVPAALCAVVADPDAELAAREAAEGASEVAARIGARLGTHDGGGRTNLWRAQ